MYNIMQITISLPEGVFPPANSTFVRKTRGKNYYTVEVKGDKVNKGALNNLSDLFSGFSINTKLEEPRVFEAKNANEINKIIADFGGLSMGGGKRNRTKRGKRKSSKSSPLKKHKKTRKHK